MIHVSAKLPPIPVWVVRVWEEEAPEGEEPLEWILLTLVEVTNCEQAGPRADWYRWSFTVEDYHHCLKTGCSIEERQVQSAERLMRLLGLLSPMAVPTCCKCAISLVHSQISQQHR